MSIGDTRLITGSEISCRIAGEDPLAAEKIKIVLSGLLQKAFRPLTHQPVVLCIGTDRSTGDSLGPLTGTKLAELHTEGVLVYGTLADPVHAVNLADTIQYISRYNADPLIVTVDACLGRKESVGCIDIGLGPIRPGAGVNKALPPVGAIYINGIVNVGGFSDYLVLQSTRLNEVIKLADVISCGVFLGFQSFFRKHEIPQEHENEALRL